MKAWRWRNPNFRIATKVFRQDTNSAAYPVTIAPTRARSENRFQPAPRNSVGNTGKARRRSFLASVILRCSNLCKNTGFLLSSAGSRKDRHTPFVKPGCVGIFGGFMSIYVRRQAALLFIFYALALTAWSGEKIPKAAWKRPIGQPLENAGKKKPALDAGHIDDGFWQGAPVGGFAPAPFPALIAAILLVGTFRVASTNTSRSLETNSSCFKGRRTPPKVSLKFSPRITHATAL